MSDLYIPIINHKNILSKKLIDNKLVITPRLVFNNRKITLNTSAKSIFDNCNDNNSIKEIVNILLIEYKLDDYDMIQKDVLDTLRSLWKIGLIKWKNDLYPFVEQYQETIGDHTMHIANIEDIKDFLEKGQVELQYINPYLFKENILTRDYLEFSIINSAAFVFILRHKNEIVAKAIIDFDVKEFIFNIQYLFIANELISIGVLSDFLNWSRKKILTIAGGYIPKKYKNTYSLTLTTDKDMLMVSYLEKVGYSKKGVLSKEVTEGDVSYYFMENPLC